MKIKYEVPELFLAKESKGIANFIKELPEDDCYRKNNGNFQDFIAKFNSLDTNKLNEANKVFAWMDKALELIKAKKVNNLACVDGYEDLFIKTYNEKNNIRSDYESRGSTSTFRQRWGCFIEDKYEETFLYAKIWFSLIIKDFHLANSDLKIRNSKRFSSISTKYKFSLELMENLSILYYRTFSTRLWESYLFDGKMVGRVNRENRLDHIIVSEVIKVAKESGLQRSDLTQGELNEITNQADPEYRANKLLDLANSMEEGDVIETHENIQDLSSDRDLDPGEKEYLDAINYCIEADSLDPKETKKIKDKITKCISLLDKVKEDDRDYECSQKIKAILFSKYSNAEKLLDVVAKNKDNTFFSKSFIIYCYQTLITNENIGDSIESIINKITTKNYEEFETRIKEISNDFKEAISYVKSDREDYIAQENTLNLIAKILQEKEKLNATRNGEDKLLIQAKIGQCASAISLFTGESINISFKHFDNQKFTDYFLNVGDLILGNANNVFYLEAYLLDCYQAGLPLKKLFDKYVYKVYQNLIIEEDQQNELEVQINKVLRLPENIETISENDAVILIQNSLSPSAAYMLKDAEEKFAIENKHTIFDGGTISQSYWKVVEIELNGLITKELLQRKVFDIKEDSSNALNTANPWAKINDLLKKNGSLMLANFSYLFRNIKASVFSNFSETKEVKSIIISLLTEEGEKALSGNFFENFLDEHKINRFRNPPAHGKPLSLETALLSRSFVLKNLKQFIFYFKATCPKNPKL